MQFSIFLPVLLVRAATLIFANGVPGGGGSGPYPATYTTDSTLSNRTIYAPMTPPSTLKIPVIVWGETGCSFNGLRFSAFLTEIASHGIIIFANGSPTGGDNPNGIAETSNPDGSQLKSSIDFIVKSAGTGKYAQVDASRIAAAGQSCGGMEAYMLYDDPRVSTIGIFNSGFTDAKNTTPSKITKPIFYFLGGSTDIAFANGERDYGILPTTTPKWLGYKNVGHMATYAEVNGGEFGVAASRWAEWMLCGNQTSSTFFTGTGAGTAVGDGWTTLNSSLAGISVTPLAT